jgi:predicted DNA repair protein MutK
MAKRRRSSARAIGTALVRVVPGMLTGLSGIGTAAMLWVGGGILLHALEELHVAEGIPDALHTLAHAAAAHAAPLSGVVEWLIGAFGSALAGIVVGGVIVVVVRRFTRHPEQLIVD